MKEDPFLSGPLLITHVIKREPYVKWGFSFCRYVVYNNHHKAQYGSSTLDAQGSLFLSKMPESNEVKIVRMETKMEDLSGQVAKMDLKIDEVIKKIDGMVLVQNEINTLKTDLVEIKTEFDKKISSLESKRWIQNTLSAVLGAVLSILLTYFFTNIGK